MTPASSHASRELSTPSLTVVSSAFEGLSNPSRWRFLAKNSETEMSRCRPAISLAVIRVRAPERSPGADFGALVLRGFGLGAPVLPDAGCDARFEAAASNAKDSWSPTPITPPDSDTE